LRVYIEQGFGVYTFKGGMKKWEGHWEDGKQNGHGKFIMEDGSVSEGMWKEGKKIEG
jgi:hypothetical protein